MKTLSIKQPWASLIAHGIKDIENRTWQTKFRGRILIHASAKIADYTLTDEQEKECGLKILWNSEKLTSAIISSVEIVDCVINHESIWAEKNEPELWDIEGKPIYDKPIYNWVLANPILFDKPITDVKGKLSLWEFDHSLITELNKEA